MWEGDCGKLLRNNSCFVSRLINTPTQPRRNAGKWRSQSDCGSAKCPSSSPYAVWPVVRIQDNCRTPCLSCPLFFQCLVLRKSEKWPAGYSAIDQLWVPFFSCVANQLGWEQYTCRHVIWSLVKSQRPVNLPWEIGVKELGGQHKRTSKSCLIHFVFFLLSFEPSAHVNPALSKYCLLTWGYHAMRRETAFMFYFGQINHYNSFAFHSSSLFSFCATCVVLVPEAPEKSFGTLFLEKKFFNSFSGILREVLFRRQTKSWAAKLTMKVHCSSPRWRTIEA